MNSNNFHPDFPVDGADIILCSQDGILFGAHSMLLSRASGFFKDMLSLPPPSSSGKAEPPVLRLDEDAAALEGIFRMIFAMEIPKLDTLDVIEPLLQIAEKYDMRGPRSIIRTVILSPQFEKHALRIYALACRYGWREEMIRTSSMTLSYNLSDPELRKEMRGMDASDLLRLMHLHYSRKQFFNDAISDLMVFPGMTPCARCGRNDVRWKVLKMMLIAEMDRCCLGDVICSPAFLEWPETVALERAVCGGCSVGGISSGSRKDRTVGLQDKLKEVIESLPQSISLEGCAAPQY